MARTGLSALILLAGIFLLAKPVMRPAAAPRDPGRPRETRSARKPVPGRRSTHRGQAAFRALGRAPLCRLQVRQINDPPVLCGEDEDDALGAHVGQSSNDKTFRIATESDDSHNGADNISVTANDVACGADQVVHQWIEVGDANDDATDHEFAIDDAPSKAARTALLPNIAPAPPVFEIEGDSGTSRKVSRRRNKSKADKATSSVNPEKKESNKVRRIVRRPSVAGMKPLDKKELGAPRPEPLARQPLIMESKDWRLRKELSKSMEARRARIQQCLDFYYDRPLANLEDSPWSMMHHMIAWGVDSRIIVRKRDGENDAVSTIGWLCGNGVCDGHKLLYVKDGKLRARVGPGVQGHHGQFMAMLAQTRVSRNQRILVDNQEFTVTDLIREEQKRCAAGTELSFRLIGLSHYLPYDATWKNSRGQKWSLTRVVAEELRQPINGTTCGGTHRLMGFTYALARRRMEGGAITGPWVQAQTVADRHIRMAFQMQNRDGSFSSDFWRSAGDWGDMNRKLKTSGHILEWLVFSLPPERLQDPRLLRNVDFVTHLLATNRYYDWENGPLGHAIRALALYDERVFGRRPGKRDLKMAENRPPLVPRRGSSNVAPPQQTSPNRNAFRRVFRRW